MGARWMCTGCGGCGRGVPDALAALCVADVVGVAAERAAGPTAPTGW